MLAVQRNAQVAIALSLCLLVFLAWMFIGHPIVGLALCMAPLLFIGTLQVPFLMVLMFIIFSFFRIHEAFPQLYPLRIPLMLAAASLTVLVWHVVITQKIQPYWRPEMTWLATFFGLVTLGLPLAVNMPEAITAYTGAYIKIGIMTLAVAWMTREAKDFSLASKMIVIAGISIALVALYNKANGIGLVEGTRVTIGRDIRSSIGDPNDLALVLMFPMAFAASLLMTPKVGVISKTIGTLGAPLLFAAVIATQSRGGLLGIMAVFGVFGYKRIKSKVLLFAIGGLAMLMLIAMAGISGRESGGAAEEGVDASAMGRLYAWQAAWSMALTHPVSGVGLNNFYANYFFHSPHWDGKNHSVHSTWFGVLAETGFLGLFVFVALIRALLKSSLRSISRIENSGAAPPGVHAAAQAVFAGLVATLVSGTFLTQGFNWPIYILTALVIALSQWVESNIPDKSTGESKL